MQPKAPEVRCVCGRGRVLRCSGAPTLHCRRFRCRQRSTRLSTAQLNNNRPVPLQRRRVAYVSAEGSCMALAGGVGQEWEKEEEVGRYRHMRFAVESPVVHTLKLTAVPASVIVLLSHF